MDIQRYKVGYYSDEWGMSSNTPCLLKDSNGYAVKYEDHVKKIEALREKLRVAEEALSDIQFGINPEVMHTVAFDAIAKIREMK